MNTTTREIMLAKCDRAMRLREYGPDEIIYSQRTPWPRAETGFECQPWPRLSLVISGNFDIQMMCDGELRTFRLRPRQSLFLIPFSSEKVIWRDWEALSLVLRPNYLRLVYSVSCQGHLAESLAYHLNSVSQATVYAMKALNALAEAGASPVAAAELARVTLSLAYADLSEASDQPSGRADARWRQMSEYAEDNCLNRISRDDLAERYKVTPEYVSRLFALHGTREGFSAFVNRCRINYAAKMLSESDETIDTIAWQCGFSHTSYFIRTFRRYHGMSPTQYRQNER